MSAPSERSRRALNGFLIGISIYLLGACVYFSAQNQAPDARTPGAWMLPDVVGVNLVRALVFGAGVDGDLLARKEEEAGSDVMHTGCGWRDYR